MRFWGAGLRFLASLMFVFPFFSLVPNAQAADGFVWQFSEGNDPANKGRMTARLSYGVPETDNARVHGVCEARSSTGVNSASLTLGSDIGNLKENENVKIRFSGGGTEHILNGSIYGTKQEEGIVGVLLDIKNSDPIWSALTSKDVLEYQIPGYRSSLLQLSAGRPQIANFIEACRSYAKALNNGPTLGLGNRATNISSKEAFESAKELGTIEAWEAFLRNFPTGFRSDLARAYLNRLGNNSSDNSQQMNAQIRATPKRPSGPADISLSITSNQPTCRSGRPCSYTITATNLGGSALAGSLAIANTMTPFGAELLPTNSNSWFCDAMGGGAMCSTDGTTLLPGQSSTLALTFLPPDNASGRLTTCATISWGGEPSASGPLEVQLALARAGYNPGPADGRPGRKTEQAIRAYQRDSGLQETGQIDLPLLMSLFTQPASGDRNPNNDEACVQSVLSNPAIARFPTINRQPVVKACTRGRVRKSGKCVCPSSASHWTGKTCIPRRTRNCTGGRYYSKKRKLCLCPSRKPHWYNNRCYARVDDCPGDSVRVGNKCIKENEPNTKSGFKQKKCSGGRYYSKKRKRCACPSRKPHWYNNRCYAGVDDCPGDSVRVGNKCIKENEPPVTRGQSVQKPCKQGKIRLASGRCVCPAGTSLIGGQCLSAKQLNKQIDNLKNIFSDRRLKEDIRHLATRKDGIKLYAFRYLWEETVRVGVMAQDLLIDRHTRSLVSMDESGFYKVNYQALGLEMVTLKEWYSQ